MRNHDHRRGGHLIELPHQLSIDSSKKSGTETSTSPLLTERSLFGGQDKTADFKWDKTADLENETKSPILKWDKTADFVEENKLPSKLFLW